MLQIQLDNHLVFRVLSKDEITERHSRALYDAGNLLLVLSTMDDEDERIRGVIVRILDSLTPGLSRDQIESLTDEEILIAIRLWTTLPDAVLPPAAGRA
jgi:hypothetical protein